MLLLTFFILSFSLGRFAKIPFFFDSANIYIYDVLALIISIKYLFFKKGGNFNNPTTFIFLYCFAFIGLCSLTLFLPNLKLIELQTAAFYLIRFCLYVTVGLSVVGSRISERKLFKTIVISTNIVGFFGLIQLIVYPDFSGVSSAFGLDPHKNRLVSLFLDPNFTAAFLCMGFSLVASHILRKEILFNKNFDKLVAVFLSVCIFLTYSRSGWLMFGVIIGILGIILKRSLLIVMLIIFFSAYFFVPRVQTRLSGVTDPKDSAHFRLTSWNQALEVFSKRQIFGVGFNSYRYARDYYGFTSYNEPVDSSSGAGADSSLLFVLATTGVVGFLFYISFYLSLIASTFKKKGFRYLFLFSLALALLLESQFINSLFYPPIMGVFFILCGLSLKSKEV